VGSNPTLSAIQSAQLASPGLRVKQTEFSPACVSAIGFPRESTVLFNCERYNSGQ
jgi:hypothetical protein